MIEFERIEFPTGEAWISGRYKCIRYAEYWFAFFKPKGWKMWGNSCELNNIGKSQTYDSLEDAQATCERHQKRFGDNPKINDQYKLHLID